MTLSKAYGLSPFDVFKQDTEDVILLINYYVEKEDDMPTQTAEPKKNKETRVRVDSKTATGGWF